MLGRDSTLRVVIGAKTSSDEFSDEEIMLYKLSVDKLRLSMGGKESEIEEFKADKSMFESLREEVVICGRGGMVEAIEQENCTRE